MQSVKKVVLHYLKKNQSTPRPSEHLPVMGENIIYDRNICTQQQQCLKKNPNASRPSEHPSVRGKKMSKRLGGIIGCKYETSSWHLNGFPDGSNIESTV